MKEQRNNAVGPQVRTKPKGASKMLPTLAAASMLAGLQSATQYFAYAYNYQTALGGNLNHFYAPWQILNWYSKWHIQYPDAFVKAGSVGVLVAGVGLLCVAVAKVVSDNTEKPNEFLHGSARWADKKDIQSAGLLPRDRTLFEVVTSAAAPTSSGVYVGGWRDKDGTLNYLRHNGNEHILTYAPTGSGKGVGLVIPTLLGWTESAVITDLKGELWELSAGWRKKHAKNKVLRFEPASSTGSICWNPLDEIRLGTDDEVGDVQNLATIIVDPDGKGMESHWQKTSFALFVGLFLHALYKSKNEGTTATLPGIDLMLADPNRDVAELWMEMATYSHINGQNHPAVGTAARDMIDRPEDEAGSVLSTAKSYLSLYRDPVVARNVSKSEFRIRDLMHRDEPVSLYIVTQPTDKARLKPLVRVMVNMIVRLLADKMTFEKGRPVANYKHRLLMMLDEFPALGKLEILQESLAFLRGYGIKAYLICQDINQLRSRETGYGHDESITSNCHIQNAYPPNRVETAEHLSRLTGQTTIVKEQITTSGKRTSAMLGQVSRTYQEVPRPLLTPDECLRMPGPRKNQNDEIEEAGDMVIYVAGYPAIYGEQMLYFQDPIFKARAAIPPPKQTDKFTMQTTKDEGIRI